MIVINNLLNGVSLEDAASAAHISQADALQLFHDTMLKVREYVLINCVPFFACDTLPDAQRNRYAVLDVMRRIEAWDSKERDVATRILKGQDHGTTQADAERISKEARIQASFYLDDKELRAYGRDPREFCRNNRTRVLGILERAVSKDNPTQYKNFTQQEQRGSEQ